METVSIRDLRGSRLRENARRAEPLMIANHRVLVGVFFPVTPAWIEKLIDYNLPRVRQSIIDGERAMREGKPLDTLDRALATGGSAAGSHDGH